MTKFEKVGISYQMRAGSKFEARKAFDTSCYICCYRGIRIECDRCAIDQAYRETIAAFDSVKCGK